MNGLRSAVLSICIAMIFSGGMLMLAPKGSERSMRFILSLILILVFASAVSCTEIGEIPKFPAESSFQSGGALADEAARQTVEAFLKDHGIPYENLMVCTDKMDDGSIVISRIELLVLDREADVAGLLKLTFPGAEVIAEYE